MSELRLRKKSFAYRLFSLFVLLAFSVNSLITPVQAQMISNLPKPGEMVKPSAAFKPALMLGVQPSPDNPFLFDFIMTRGDGKLQGAEFEQESARLIKYFLAAITIPDSEAWVNLSPYEQDRIIPEALSSTEMGRDMLAQDYILKQFSASLTNPQEKLGETFWSNVYAKAREKFGTSQIPINTFNKVWIVPDVATVLEQNGTAFVAESHLKVMLEGDYVSLKENLNSKKFGTEGMDEQEAQKLSDISSSIVREIIIPELEREVNEGKNFASLRQIYNSVILAVWYKKTLKDSLLGKVYMDQKKTVGVDALEKDAKEQIYAQYIEAFRRGVYNLIKEDDDPAVGRIPRKYFSGGVAMQQAVEERLVVAQWQGPGQFQVTSFNGAPVNSAAYNFNRLSAEIANTLGRTTGATITGNQASVVAVQLAEKPAESVNVDPRLAEIARGYKDGIAAKSFVEQQDGRFGLEQMEKIEGLLRSNQISPKIAKLIMDNLKGEGEDPVILGQAEAEEFLQFLIIAKDFGIALYPITGNPPTRGHKGIGLATIALTGASMTYYIVAAEDPRKEGLPAYDLRAGLVQAIATYSGGLLGVSNIAHDINYIEQHGADLDLDGEHNIFKVAQRIHRFLEANNLIAPLKAAGVKIKLHYVVGGDHAEWDLPAKPKTGLAVIRQSSVADLIGMLDGFERKEEIAQALRDLSMSFSSGVLVTPGFIKTQLESIVSPDQADAIVKSLETKTIPQADTAKKLADNIAERIFDFDSDLFDIEMDLVARIEGENLTPEQREQAMKKFNQKAQDLQTRVGDIFTIRVMPPYILDNVSATVIREGNAELMPKEVVAMVREKGIIKGYGTIGIGRLLMEARQDLAKLQGELRQIFNEDIAKRIITALDDIAVSESAGFLFDPQMNIKALANYLGFTETELATLLSNKDIGIQRLVNQILNPYLSLRGRFVGVSVRIANESTGSSLQFAVKSVIEAFLQGSFTEFTVQEVQSYLNLIYPKEEFQVEKIKEILNADNRLLQRADVYSMPLGSRIERSFVSAADQGLSVDQIVDKVNKELPQALRISAEQVTQYLATLTQKGWFYNSSTKMWRKGQAQPQQQQQAQDKRGAEENLGGIDFDPAFLNLQIKRDGRGVPLPLPQQNLENIHIDGLYPVIINISPATIKNFPFLLSAEESKSEGQLSLIAQ